MISPHLAKVRRWFTTATVAVGLAFSFTPAPAPAAGLGDLIAGMSVQQGCTSFVAPTGAQVPVQYYLPGSNCAAPAVIVLHGSDGGTRYQDDYEEICRGLAAKGYAAFLVYYYEGAPGAPRPNVGDRTLPDPRAFVPWVATVEQSISFVQRFPGVDPNRIGIMGLSLGGFVGSSAAVNDPRVRSLVVLSGGMPEQWAKQMKAMPPTLLVHGDRDADVPVWEAYKLHDRMARKGIWHDLEILPCEGHLPYRAYKEQVAEKVLCFLDSTL